MTASSHDAFVPLMPAPSPSGAAAARATLLPRAAAERLTRSSVSPQDTPPAVAAQPLCGGAPRVSVQRQGDVVSGIRIECVCGHVIDLACVYQPPPATR